MGAADARDIARSRSRTALGGMPGVESIRRFQRLVKQAVLPEGITQFFLVRRGRLDRSSETQGDLH
jgi:hypothetical protein